jgi:hypothetical protein
MRSGLRTAGAAIPRSTRPLRWRGRGASPWRPTARAGEEALCWAAPVFVRYESDGPVYTLRIFAVEKWVQHGGELEEAVRECLG